MSQKHAIPHKLLPTYAELAKVVNEHAGHCRTMVPEDKQTFTDKQIIKLSQRIKDAGRKP